MTKYYFTTSMLPPISIGEKPEMNFEELEELLQENLLPKDYEQTKILKRFYDILNIRAFWKNDELDPHGNFNVNELEEAVLDHIGLPGYVNDFLDTYKSKEERLKHFPLLISKYFRDEVKNGNKFVKEYLEFERKLQLVLVGFRAKKLGRSLEKELQFENPNDDIIAQILAQKDAEDFEPPEAFHDLKQIFKDYQDHPIKLYQSLFEYRFHKIEEMMGNDPFSFSKILGYLLELMMAEKWMELDEKKGLEMIDHILEKSTGEK